MEKNKILTDELFREIPLETRLNVLNEMTCINLIRELGYREEKCWTEDENEILSKLIKIARGLTTDTLNEIYEWEKETGNKFDSTKYKNLKK